MRVDDFDFELPEACIATEPARPRDSARLLEVANGALHDYVIRDLPARLRPGDVLVVNDTRVRPVQLQGRRPARSAQHADARIDVTLIKQDRDARWHALVRPLKRLQQGDVIHFGEDFAARVEDRHDAMVVLAFADQDADFLQKLDRYGAMPLPPYIRKQRAPNDQDREDYQTLFAAKAGAVAAPTAGLHFTPPLLRRLQDAGIAIERLTLHVGLGTFKPVNVADTADHVMHSEWGQLDAETAARLNRVRAQGGRVIAVGTTVVRLLESIARDCGRLTAFAGETDIFVTPGYRFRAIDGMMTNFHLPRSTLLMLVAAFIGLAPMQQAYAHAVETGYRFYSYGDACLLWPAVATE